MPVSVVLQLQSSPATNKLSNVRAFIFDPCQLEYFGIFATVYKERAFSSPPLVVNKFPDLWRENHAPRAMGSGDACVLRV